MMRSFFREHRDWFRSRLHGTDPLRCVVKLMEECGELAAAVYRRDWSALEDAVGDVMITVCSVALAHGIDPSVALRQVWANVKNRSTERVRDGEATDKV